MIFTHLILAHLLGDFLLQPNAWVSHKERKKTASIYLYLHGFIHFALVIIVLWNIKLWWIAAVVAVSHLIIDALKLHFQTHTNKRTWFFLDQALHIAVIAGVSALYFPYWRWCDLFSSENIRIATAIIFLTLPSSILIKTLISIWTPEETSSADNQTESLINAGKYIGILERLLVFVFILVNHWEGVGFMIAAKSVFRFSDLAQAKQRKLTEYVLIGTLLSFGIAVIVGILVQI